MNLTHCSLNVLEIELLFNNWAYQSVLVTLPLLQGDTMTKAALIEESIEFGPCFQSMVTCLSLEH